MPDFFLPSPPWPSDRFPPETDEDKEKLQEFFGGPASPPKSVAALKKVVEQLKAGGASKVGAFGFCWGGKVTLLAGSGSTPRWIRLHSACCGCCDPPGRAQRG
jgi:dienelactone hydrolase